MAMRPIALLASPHYHDTVTWLRLNYPIKKIENRRVTMLNGEIYYIINRQEDLEGMEFSGYILAPNYVSLVDEVKRRIR